MRRPRIDASEAFVLQSGGGAAPCADDNKKLSRGWGSVAKCLTGFGIATLIAAAPFGWFLTWIRYFSVAQRSAVGAATIAVPPTSSLTVLRDAGLTSPTLPETTAKPAGEFDALLDELIGLHRGDVAAREAAEVAPLDLPVYETDRAVVVTMADGGYGACAIQLIQSARDAGRWGGPVVVLVPVGEGTVPLLPSDVSQMQSLGATLFEVGPEAAGGSQVRGAGSAAQYAKVALLVDKAFRKYETILYLDADGAVGAPVQPLIDAPLPAGRAVAMPTWPSTKVTHESFYTREVNLRVLSPAAAGRLRAECPDRLLVGITAWFLIRPQLLPEPSSMRAEVDAALESWRASFRFNDQGLWNALFYNTSAFYPLCVSGPSPSSHLREPFSPFIVDSLAQLGETIDAVCGPGHERRKPLYQHPLKDCIPMEEWERKKRSNRELAGQQRKDIAGAFDRVEGSKRHHSAEGNERHHSAEGSTRHHSAEGNNRHRSKRHHSTG